MSDDNAFQSDCFQADAFQLIPITYNLVNLYSVEFLTPTIDFNFIW